MKIQAILTIDITANESEEHVRDILTKRAQKMSDALEIVVENALFDDEAFAASEDDFDVGCHVEIMPPGRVT